MSTASNRKKISLPEDLENSWPPYKRLSCLDQIIPTEGWVVSIGIIMYTKGEWEGEYNGRRPWVEWGKLQLFEWCFEFAARDNMPFLDLTFFVLY